MNTAFTNEFSQEVWATTYKYHTDECLSDTFMRVAKDIASVEIDPEYWTAQFYKVLSDFAFVPGGRITSNAGTGLKGTTYLNCFVSGPGGVAQDSIEGILRELSHQTLILKSEGGYGFNCDFMRPRGAFIRGSGVESPGAVKMLEMWNSHSTVVTAGSGQKKKTKEGKGKIRKGAMMVVQSCWNPSIEEFITAKQTKGHSLDKFNMSVGITDDFMNAVENNLSWNLEFPDTKFEQYDLEWDGNLVLWKSKGYPVNTYKTYKDANELWDLLMKATYTRNEPGVLFLDRINHFNNLSYMEYISATNPCGEQVLPQMSACLLGSLNLTKFVNEDMTDWDYAKIAEYLPIIVRFLDNVNDRSKLPLPEQEEEVRKKRRIGIGYLGYASALCMIGNRYGSVRALEITDNLGNFVANKAYSSSALLAKEKGVFDCFDKEKYLQSNFIKMALTQETIDLIEQHGMRNSHLLSIQPTGNSSVYANNVSGGLEPMFSTEYIRTSIVSEPSFEIPLIDWQSKTFIATTGDWKWIKEGDESMLATVCNGIVYKIDQSRGLVKETLIEDYSVHILKNLDKWNPQAESATTAFGLTLDDHINTMKVFSKYVDAAMSKTINLPNNFPYEDFKNLYRDLYKTGTIKGATTYREGTMSSVLSTSSSMTSSDDKIKKNNAPKRPKKMPCDIYHVVSGKEKYVVLVGLLEKEPYEVWAIPNGSEGEEQTGAVNDKTGFLIKVKPGQYDLLLSDKVISDITQFYKSEEQQALSRMISTALRHGADIKFVVQQLLKSEGNILSFSKCIARTLKRYLLEPLNKKCPDCGSKNIVMSEGCSKCSDCGHSACA